MMDGRLVAALWLAQIQAGTAVALAAMRAPWISMRDVYLPFGSGFAQDIDPVTLWWLPRSAGLRPGSPEAAELLTLFGQQQALVAALLARTGAPAGAAPRAADAPLPLTGTERDLLARTTRRIAALTGAALPQDTEGIS
jgi:hypothetical protein